MEDRPLNESIVPADVDMALVTKRNDLFNRYRAGKLSGVEAYSSSLDLYWTTAEFSNDATRHYLMDATFEISLEAGVDPDISGDIWEERSNFHNAN